jgi:hypothetical protein
MSEEMAVHILNGSLPMPENMTVESVFFVAHIVPHPITPF